MGMIRALAEPLWRANVLDIDTGIAREGLERLTIARIDTREITTWSFDQVLSMF